MKTLGKSFLQKIRNKTFILLHIHKYKCPAGLLHT